MIISKNIARIAAVTGLVLGSFSLAALADWTAPTTNPPSCPTNQPGCDAPIHTGGAAQTKRGALTVNSAFVANALGDKVTSTGFVTFGKSIFNGLVQIVDGSQGINKILTSDANGLAKWKTLAEVISNSSVTNNNNNNTEVSLTGNLKWVRIDQGASTRGSGGNVQQFTGVYWNANSENHNPDDMCLRAGYSFATGACKLDPYGNANYFGSVSATNQNGQWKFVCKVDTDSPLPASASAEAKILCAR